MRQRPSSKAREKRPGDEVGFVWSFDTVFRRTYRRFSIAFKVILSLSDVMIILPNVNIVNVLTIL